MSHTVSHERKNGEPRRRKMMPDPTRRLCARNRDLINEGVDEYETSRAFQREETQFHAYLQRVTMPMLFSAQPRVASDVAVTALASFTDMMASRALRRASRSHDCLLQ